MPFARAGMVPRGIVAEWVRISWFRPLVERWVSGLAKARGSGPPAAPALPAPPTARVAANRWFFSSVIHYHGGLTAPERWVRPPILVDC